MLPQLWATTGVETASTNKKWCLTLSTLKDDKSLSELDFDFLEEPSYNIAIPSATCSLNFSLTQKEYSMCMQRSFYLETYSYAIF